MDGSAKRIKQIVIPVVLGLVILFLGSARLLAQDVAVGSATVEVLEGITISSPQPLDFGDILQGVPRDIANSDGSSAGIFEITGADGAGVELYLQLPSYLTLDASGDRLEIVFSSSDISIDTTGAGSPAGMDGSRGWQNVNPHSMPSGTVIGSSSTDLYLGGKVLPSPVQKPGSYSGEIVLTVDYTGM